MNLGEDIRRESNKLRRLIYGPDAVLNLYAIDGEEWSIVLSLSDDFCPSQGRAVGGASFREWLVDLWNTEWASVQTVAAAKLQAHGQTLTFKLRDPEREIVGGKLRLRFPMQMIGDQA